MAIFGAGPTGLTAAIRLAAVGIDHPTVDANTEPTRTSNAALVHASALELLAELDEHLVPVPFHCSSSCISTRVNMCS